MPPTNQMNASTIRRYKQKFQETQIKTNTREMVGKRKQKECRFTNEQQERLIELNHNESNLWNVSSVSYQKKECRQGVLLYTKQNISASHNN